MVGPMDRPAEPWYSDGLDAIAKEFDDAIRKVNRSNVSKIGSLVRTSQIFDEDKTHLTMDAEKSSLKQSCILLGNTSMPRWLSSTRRPTWR